MVRHAKSVLDSQPSHQTAPISGVSKTEMRLLAAEESRSRSRKEQLTRWHAAATGKLREMFTAVSGMWLQRSAKATCPALLASQSRKCSLEISGGDE